MALNRAEMARTADELRRNLRLVGLTEDELGAWLGLRPDELHDVLTMGRRAQPKSVWLVRDAIDQAGAEQGTDCRWSVLTDQAREKADHWFRLRRVPARIA